MPDRCPHPKSWPLIIGVLAATVTLLGIVTSSFHQTLQSGLAAVSHEPRGEIGSVRAEIEGLRTEMRTAFRRVDQRLDHLDHDVQTLTRHVVDRPG